MGIKEFFKLSILKIVLAIIIFIILMVLTYSFSLKYYLQFAYCMSIGCPTSQSETGKIMAIAIIPALIISYILSCFIVYLFKKK
jgi:hypothetical protein